MQNSHLQIQEDNLPSPNPIKEVKEPSIQIETKVAGQFLKKLFQILFYSHLLLISILTISLTVRGLLSAHTSHFRPEKWYPPLLTSTVSATIVSFAWQWFTLFNPSKALRAAFWLSPLLTCAVGVLLIYIGTAGSLAAGAVSLISGIIQSLYTCWVNPRFKYAAQILSASLATPPKTTIPVTLSIITGLVYSCFLVAGIGGATTTGAGLEILFILAILLSLAWSKQVIRNILQVTVSRIGYLNFACGVSMDTKTAFRDTFKHLMGSVFVGSALSPIIGVIRGSARALSLIAGDTDEFLFSCANCYASAASTLITYGNRWGFVQVGVYNKGFVQASSDTWEMFQRVGLESVINSDLTGSFCFFCGMAGGATCTLIGGIWEVAVHKSYATEVSIYAFLIGYFMCRIAMAWPQACVSAYYVAYAENPHSPQFDSTIPVRKQELQRYQV